MKAVLGQYHYAPHRSLWGVWVWTSVDERGAEGTFVKDFLAQRAQLQQLHEETLSDPTARDADTYMDLYKAIEKLRPEYREVIKLYYLDDLSVKEIAQILNKNENTIKTQLFRARDTLKSVLEA